MTEKIFKSALTLTLGFAVCAYAEPFHSEDFSDYADGYSITNAPSWTGGAEDESKVVEANGEKYLALNTNGGELINTLSNTNDINAAKDAGIYFEAKVKFVPSDTLTDLSDLEQASSDAKFAIYALAEENGPTNLVVFHRFYDGSDYPTTNEVFTSVSLPDDTVTVRVDYKKEAYYAEGAYLFKVSIDGSPLTSGCPYYADASEGSEAGVEDWACWMQTVKNSDISSVCFKGTGEVDDIVVDAATTTVNVTVTGGANATAVWTVDGTTVSAPATLTEGQTYSVVYTANQGYEFAQGATTTASGTAGTENIVIAIADATAIQQAGWVDDSSTIPANTPAGTQYPALADSALATADAKKLTDWAKAKNIDFATVDADTEGTLVDAFLLNCALAEVEAEKAAFVLNITFDNGVPVVSTPTGKTYNVEVQLKGSNDLSTWTDTATTSGYQFFKAELKLPAANN